MAIEVRPLRVKDFEAWFTLQHEAMADPLTQRGIKSEYQSKRSLRLGGWVDDRLIGVFLGWLVVDELQVIQIATHVDARRSGVGNALLSQALSEACSRGARRATLEVRQSNTPAIALYRHHGFIDDGIRRRFYADGESALLMSWTSSSTQSDDG